MVYDDKGTILTSSMNKSLVEQSFFSNYTQDFFNHNKILMNLTKSLVTGKASYARYDYGTGEILTTQSPLLINGKLRDLHSSTVLQKKSFHNYRKPFFLKD